MLAVPAQYATRVGEQRLVQLDDGTSIQLSTQSRIAVSFTDKARTIELVAGEALFDVGTDARPFSVRSGTAVIRDIGTRFDVRRDAKRIHVTVVSGSVRVDVRPPAKRSQHAARTEVAELNALDAVTISTDVNAPPDAIRRLSAEELRRNLAWTRGRLAFYENPVRGRRRVQPIQHQTDADRRSHDR